jgi:multidrug transporter EmrE-like cation transporter
MQSLPLILLGVLLNAVAQLLLKQGMLRVGSFGLDLATLSSVAPKIMASPFVWAGLVSYVLSVAVWLVVLSRVDVSYAYPMVGLGYVFATAVAWAVFHEDVSLMRLAGILVVCAGVYIIARTG